MAMMGAALHFDSTGLGELNKAANLCASCHSQFLECAVAQYTCSQRGGCKEKGTGGTNSISHAGNAEPEDNAQCRVRTGGRKTRCR